MPKPLISVVALLAVLSALSAKIIPLEFENPGSRRLLKTEAGNYYYYQSLPEKSLTLNVAGITTFELRAFTTEDIRKPQVITIINKKKVSYDLEEEGKTEDIVLFQPLQIEVPENTATMQILCYERGIYFRPFFALEDKPKPQKLSNLEITAHGGIISVSHDGEDSDYYSFNPSQSLKFTINNSRQADLYVRVRILDRSEPSLALYRNGELLSKHTISQKRTSQYKATGIAFLSTGVKIHLPAVSGAAVYELRASSDHLFLARPVILKKK